MAGKRENFGSRFAVVMAMAGSAIGLGNIWRFPYMVGEYGGAAFIIIYMVSTLLISLPIFLSEMLIGRRTQQSTIGAFRTLAPGSSWGFMGLLTVISPLIILSYYSVVGGWSVEYLIKALGNGFGPGKVTAGFFSAFIASPTAPIAFHTVFLAICALVVLGGVKKGIELFSKITMPLLLVLIVLIVIYSVSLPGAAAGVGYLIHPDFSKITPSVVASAMGQSFYSLSLGVGTILTYASYVRKEENLLGSAAGTAGFDLLFALIAGFAVMPAVFAAGIAPGSGPGLVFDTLPYIFSFMGSRAPVVSYVVSVLFFLTILVAAVSSAISMFEVGVAYLNEERKIDRKLSCLIVFACCWALGCLCSLSMGPLSGVKVLGNTFFELCDKTTSNFLMPFGGLIFTVFAGWRMSRSDVRQELSSDGKHGLRRALFEVIYFLIKYVAPIAILIIFATNLIL